MTAPSSWIGIPFLSGGRDRAGCDCWGLVLLYAREVNGRLGPDFAYEDALSNRSLILFRQHRDSHAVMVKAPSPGDLILLRPAGLPVHVGTCLTGNRFLHTQPGSGSVIDRWDSLVWRNRLSGFWRWK